MSEVSIEELLALILKAAENKLSIAMYYGDASEGAKAEKIKEQVKFYKLGMENKIPEEWKKYIPVSKPESSKTSAKRNG